ncbi:MAG: hypothetical protein IJY65_02940 [Clostridia bacterium]|nr:hypothetical protein [Clostridia bacterium]
MMKTIALVDSRISEECSHELSRRGFSVLKLPPHERLSPPLASHTDMLAFHIENTLLFPQDYLEKNPEIEAFIKRARPDIKILGTATVPSAEYPHDAVMNALVTKRSVFAKTDSVCPDILALAKSLGYEVRSVKQGYPACTALALGGVAVTADEGMRRALEVGGVRVYKISGKNIALPPYEYGFIGGACGVFEKTVYFLGDLEAHPDAPIIKEAISEAGCAFVSLSGGGLVDLGGILFI